MTASAGPQTRQREDGTFAPRVVIVVAGPGRAGRAYRVESPDRVLRMFGLLNATRDVLDMAALPAESRERVQHLLEIVSGELERSVSPPLAGELHDLVPHETAPPSSAQLRIEYAGLLGWTSGLVVAMFSELADAVDKPQQTACEPSRLNI